jgi:hypothetical protein
MHTKASRLTIVAHIGNPKPPLFCALTTVCNVVVNVAKVGSVG